MLKPSRLSRSARLRLSTSFQLTVTGHGSLVTLKSYSSRAEAELARAILAANGIDSVITSDDAGGMQPWFQQSLGVRLLVAHEQAIRAAWLLEPREDGDESLAG